jgi:hypothetical protein
LIDVAPGQVIQAGDQVRFTVRIILDFSLPIKLHHEKLIRFASVREKLGLSEETVTLPDEEITHRRRCAGFYLQLRGGLW